MESARTRQGSDGANRCQRRGRRNDPPPLPSSGQCRVHRWERMLAPYGLSDVIPTPTMTSPTLPGAWEAPTSVSPRHTVDCDGTSLLPSSRPPFHPSPVWRCAQPGDGLVMDRGAATGRPTTGSACATPTRLGFAPLCSSPRVDVCVLYSEGPTRRAARALGWHVEGVLAVVVWSGFWICPFQTRQTSFAPVQPPRPI